MENLQKKAQQEIFFLKLNKSFSNAKSLQSEFKNTDINDIQSNFHDLF